MVWSADQDGFEHSYFKGPNGPTYVKRKLLSSHCVFGEFPDEAAPTEVKVSCGATWTGTHGHSLSCVCLDAGHEVR